MSATVLEADVIRAIDCESGGNVWVFSGAHEEDVGSQEALSCYDPAGNLGGEAVMQRAGGVGRSEYRLLGASVSASAAVRLRPTSTPAGRCQAS